ncbi:ureidoglycolate hydrolase [Dichotomopilus funicola]|uniref:Ureidoglycolate hydrolase n=1 Tax=Dichotomopilus funicola TaxID=1934379 RepID=A0AAN6ZLI5_9PEZI|nr:ureidoglycolate hydrolase [Dichotomopilus funicola]
MAENHKLIIPSPGAVIEATALTPEAFAPFGDVVENPRPDVHPSRAENEKSVLPFNAVVANQGSAVKYQHVSRQVNLYGQAPSGRPASAIMSMFVCAARVRLPDPLRTASPTSRTTTTTTTTKPSPPTSSSSSLPSKFPITVLERHPYTTQTFIPLSRSPSTRYLVIVAPTLPSNPTPPYSSSSAPKSGTTSHLPVPSHLPTSLPEAANYPRPLPGSGPPDLQQIRAFIATGAQAVTYGAGTWHAPMVALGEGEEAVDFVVVQFANGVGEEDCQEVFFEAGEGDGEIVVSVSLGVEESGRVEKAKL